MTLLLHETAEVRQEDIVVDSISPVRLEWKKHMMRVRNTCTNAITQSINQSINQSTNQSSKHTCILLKLFAPSTTVSSIWQNFSSALKTSLATSSTLGSNHSNQIKSNQSNRIKSNPCSCSYSCSSTGRSVGLAKE
jgi:hypothetical protein